MFIILKGKRCYDFDVEEINWNKVNSNRHEIFYSFCVLWLYWVVRTYFNGNAIIQGSVQITCVIQCFKMR